MINVDGLNNAPLEEVATTTFQLLHANQQEKPHMQLAAACCYFVLLTEHYRVNQQDVMTAMKNLLAKDGWDGTEPRFKALRMFMKYEMPR